MRVPIFPSSYQHLLLSVILTIIILEVIRWFIPVVLICISLMANDFEHVFMSLLANCMHVTYAYWPFGGKWGGGI